MLLNHKPPEHATKSRSWLREYYSTIGASQAATVVGASPWNSPLDLYETMRNVADGIDPEPIEPNSDMERGNRLEPIAREILAETIGEIREHDQDEFCYSPMYPFAHALPDGWTKGGSVIELKVPRPATIAKLRREGIPRHYLCQVQHQMAVTGTEECVFAALDPVNMDMVIVPVDRDKDLIDQLMEAEQSFVEGVRCGRPPVVLDDPTIDLPADTGGIVTLDTAEAKQAAQHFLRCKAMLEDAKALTESARQSFIQQLEDREAVKIPGIGKFYHRQTAGRRTFDSAKACKAFPELNDDTFWKQGKPSRTLRAYPYSNEE